MLFDLIAKLLCAVVISILFIINSLFKLCASSENKRVKFYYNFFMYYLTIFLSTTAFLPLFLFRPKNVYNLRATVPIFEYLGYNILEIELIVRNSDVLSKSDGAVIMETHQSSLDMLTCIMTWKIAKNMAGMSKKELLYIFPVGLTMYLGGIYMINRKNAAQAYKDFKNVGAIAKEHKCKLWLHPEGTRNHNKKTMLPFKRGIFHLAVISELPIIPIVSSPFYFLNYEEPSFEKPRIILQVLDAIPTKGLTSEDIPELMKTVRQRMWDEYKKLYTEIYPNEILSD